MHQISPMSDLISKLDSSAVLGLCGMLVGIVAILGAITVAITKVVSAHYRRSQLDEMEATLKMEMIQRGMSAPEIKQVLESKMGSSRSALGDLLSSLPNMRRPNFVKEAKRSQSPQVPHA
jgi:hypothetical protein